MAATSVTENVRVRWVCDPANQERVIHGIPQPRQIAKLLTKLGVNYGEYAQEVRSALGKTAVHASQVVKDAVYVDVNRDGWEDDGDFYLVYRDSESLDVSRSGVVAFDRQAWCNHVRFKQTPFPVTGEPPWRPQPCPATPVLESYAVPPAARAAAIVWGALIVAVGSAGPVGFTLGPPRSVDSQPDSPSSETPKAAQGPSPNEGVRATPENAEGPSAPSSHDDECRALLGRLAGYTDDLTDRSKQALCSLSLREIQERRATDGELIRFLTNPLIRPGGDFERSLIKAKGRPRPLVNFVLSSMQSLFDSGKVANISHGVKKDQNGCFSYGDPDGSLFRGCLNQYAEAEWRVIVGQAGAVTINPKFESTTGNITPDLYVSSAEGETIVEVKSLGSLADPRAASDPSHMVLKDKLAAQATFYANEAKRRNMEIQYVIYGAIYDPVKYRLAMTAVDRLAALLAFSGARHRIFLMREMGTGENGRPVFKRTELSL